MVDTVGLAVARAFGGADLAVTLKVAADRAKGWRSYWRPSARSYPLGHEGPMTLARRVRAVRHYVASHPGPEWREARLVQVYLAYLA